VDLGVKRIAASSDTQTFGVGHTNGSRVARSESALGCSGNKPAETSYAVKR